MHVQCWRTEGPVGSYLALVLAASWLVDSPLCSWWSAVWHSCSPGFHLQHTSGKRPVAVFYC